MRRLLEPRVALLLALAVLASESARPAFFSYVGLVDCDGVSVGRKHIYLACHSSGDQLPIRANGTEAVPGNAYAYVLRIDPQRRKLIYVARIGGHGYTAAFRIKVDDRGVAYVVGITNAKDFPTTVDVVQRRRANHQCEPQKPNLNLHGDPCMATLDRQAAARRWVRSISLDQSDLTRSKAI